MEIFHRQKLLDEMDGDTEFLKEILTIFLKGYPKTLEEIWAAIEAGDCRGIEKGAHRLKGSLAVIFAVPAYEAAYQLEMLGKENNLESARMAYHHLEKEIFLLKEVLEKTIKN